MIKLIYNDFGALMIDRLTNATEVEKNEYEKIFKQESIQTDSFKKYKSESTETYKNKSINEIKTDLQAKKGFIFTQLNDIHIDNDYRSNHYNGFFKLTNITSNNDSALFLQNIFKIENLVIPEEICEKPLYEGKKQRFFTPHGLFPRYFNLDARFRTKGLVFLYGTMDHSIKSPDNRNILGIQMRNMNKSTYGTGEKIMTEPDSNTINIQKEVKEEHKALLHDHIKHLEDNPLNCQKDHHTNYLDAYFNDFYEKFMIVGYSLKENPNIIYSIFKPYLDSVKVAKLDVDYLKYINKLTGILVDENGEGDIKHMEIHTPTLKTILYKDRNQFQQHTGTERLVVSVVKQFIIKMSEEFKKGSSVSFYVTPIKNLDSINGQFNILTFGGDKSEELIEGIEKGVIPGGPAADGAAAKKPSATAPATAAAAAAAATAAAAAAVANHSKSQITNKAVTLSDDNKIELKKLLPDVNKIKKSLDDLEIEDRSKDFLIGLLDELQKITNSNQSNKSSIQGGSLKSNKTTRKVNKAKKRGNKKSKKR